MPFELELDAPAFVMITPAGPVTAPLSVRASHDGSTGCVSEEVADASFRVQLDAGDLHCDLPATFIRVAAHLQMLASNPTCQWGADGTAPGYHFVFNLAHADGQLAGSVLWEPV